MANRSLHVPHLGHDIILVDREQLRFKSHTRQFVRPSRRKGLAVTAPAPQSFDWSRGRAIKYPILGNDRFGDCYYAAVAHGSQTWTGNSGIEYQFDVNALTNRYQKLSGGDNGLSDSDIMPEWKTGIIGPNGPRKILDELIVNVNDVAACHEAAWRFGGLIWTCALKTTWLDNIGPGVVWGNTGSPDESAGHAMYITGRLPNGNWQAETWGIDPPVQVTPDGLQSADSELIVAFSADQFDPKAGLSVFTGQTWEVMRQTWLQYGGKDVGPSPFAPPPPPPPPGPIKSRISVSAWCDFPDGGNVGTVTGTCSRKSASKVVIPPALWPLIIEYGMRVLPVILAGLAAKHSLRQIIADVLAALRSPDPTPDN